MNAVTPVLKVKLVPLVGPLTLTLILAVSFPLKM